MSADKRIMTTVLSSDRTNNDTFLLTDNATKLLVTRNNYGICYCGAAALNGIPTEYYMRRYINEMEDDIGVEDTVKILSLKLKNVSTNNIVLIAGGYYQNEGYICSNNTINPEKISTQTTFGESSSLKVTYAGRNDIANKYYQNNILAFDYKKFTTRDAVQFLAYINYTVASELHFSQSPQDVSIDCDILVITQDNYTWTTGKENLL